MNSIFYIIEDKGMYQLRLRANHYCISSGTDIDTRLKVAERYLKKYKTSEGIINALNHLTQGCFVNESMVKRCEERIRQGLTYGTQSLLDLELKCAEFNLNNTPLKRTKKIIGKMLSPKIIQERKEEVVNTSIKRPTVLKKITPLKVQ